MDGAHGVCGQEHGHMEGWRIEKWAQESMLGKRQSSATSSHPVHLMLSLGPRAAEGARETWEEKQPQGVPGSTSNCLSAVRCSKVPQAHLPRPKAY